MKRSRSDEGSFKRKSIARLVHSLLAISALYGSQAGAEQFEFNPDFLKFSDGKNADHIDLSYFSRRGMQAPGDYYVRILLNGDTVDSKKLTFKSRSDVAKMVPCLNKTDLIKWGISADALADKGDICDMTLGELIPGATDEVSLNQMTYRLSVPQKYLQQGGWLRTPGEIWDRGTTALMLNYDYSGSQTTYNAQTTQNNYVGLDGSLNLLGWRLKSQGNWTQGTDSESKFTTLNTYLSRDYAFAQGGVLSIGQINTADTLFDSLSLDGIKAESDDGMLIPSLATYSPVIKGIASSQAVVTVRQNGAIIYQQNVAPGAFELRGVSTVGSGDLQVEVKEADGTVRRFTQATGSIPLLQHEGRVRYNVSAGRYRNTDSRGEEPVLFQSSVAWGLPQAFTLYGGVQLSQDYDAVMVGAGHAFLSLGALSVDVTQARARFDRQHSELGAQRGQSVRVMYAKSLETGTDISVAGYRYGSQGFYSFADMQNAFTEENEGTHWRYQRLRSRAQLSINQDLSNFGQVSLSGSQDRYWDAEHSNINWMASYNKSFNGINTSLSFSWRRNQWDDASDRQVFVNVSVPLSSFLTRGTMSSNTSVNTYNSRTNIQTGVSGSSADSKVSYTVSQGIENQGNGANGNANLMYTGAYGTVSGGYGYFKEGQQMTYSVRGGITAHPHGITLSQPVSLDSANALVSANGASGVDIKNGAGIGTDIFGYAVVPNLIPYQQNRISLDVSSLDDDVDARNTDTTIIPTRGALVPVKFDVAVGKRAMFILRYRGQPLPLGSQVSVLGEQGSPSSGIVSDGGQVYLSGLPDQGQVKAIWSTNEKRMQCTAGFRLSGHDFSITPLDCL
ncbi:fimbrial biogenesis outer membrane usher protein [Hafnia paralvei]|uniref:fimbria/pilus outer membrane usher protein n=1 Tax=Hafnia paralvei TaxID=546367 RepID=UPI00103323AA|nr:fimbria/pilus outer membrane usher protein [Hafnia paralvei]MDX6840845.1 fimbria/pilus outer membrane usher protein [Hafnia paralvei]TBM01117.1 fimbrial biogenesis outer membrane usher protein [Hafnia paralvei]